MRTSVLTSCSYSKKICLTVQNHFTFFVQEVAGDTGHGDPVKCDYSVTIRKIPVKLELLWFTSGGIHIRSIRLSVYHNW